MKIGFIFNAPCNILEITQNPTDESAAAVAFLAIQLAKLAHAVTIFSYSPNAQIYDVRCRHIEIKDQALILDPALLENDFEILIFKNTSPEFAISIKNSLPYKPKIFLWTDQMHTAPLNKGLWSREITDQLTGILCVSQWQRLAMVDALDIMQNKVLVLKYAISPLFEDLFIDDKEFINIKSKTPQMAYIAAQENGLNILLDSYYNITANFETASLGIFANVNDKQLMSSIEQEKSIRVYGAATKTQLVTWLRTFTIFTNPNTLAATSNVTLLEAMALGLYPITSDIGANADYCQGHGTIVPTAMLTSNTLDNYISEVLKICQAQNRSGSDFYDYCFKQASDINKKHTWRVRAKELLELLNHSVLNL